MRPAFAQSSARIRFDWGLSGALALCEQPGTAAVVVDVLSFSTAVSVACDAGIEVFPFRWRDDRASEFAAEQGAALAAGRRDGDVSLSPASIRAWLASRNQAGPSDSRPGGYGPGDAGPGDAGPGGSAASAGRLVLPSPNGSSICFALGDRGGPVLAGCLRNAAAVAGWLARELTNGRIAGIAVVAAGEQWPDGGLRPAVEDLWGAGAVLARLRTMLSAPPLSPEARAAADAFEAAGPELSRLLQNCASGSELIEDGFAEDVVIAAELDAARTAPVLTAARFRAA